MTQHSRTVTWTDPAPYLQQAQSMSGLDYMRAMFEGVMPPTPIAVLMNMRGVRADEGEVVFEGTPDASLYNPIGLVHGGFCATLLDSAMGCAVHTTLPAGVGYSTVQLNVHYVRAILPTTGTLTCTGRVTYRGNRQATATAELVDASGKLYAHGTSACLILTP